MKACGTHYELQCDKSCFKRLVLSSAWQVCSLLVGFSMVVQSQTHLYGCLRNCASIDAVRPVCTKHKYMDLCPMLNFSKVPFQTTCIWYLIFHTSSDILLDIPKFLALSDQCIKLSDDRICNNWVQAGWPFGVLHRAKLQNRYICGRLSKSPALPKLNYIIHIHQGAKKGPNLSWKGSISR